MQQEVLYSFIWNDREDKIKNKINEFYVNARYADCCLMAEGVIIPAHKIILAACSPYFENLLGQLWSKSGTSPISMDGKPVVIFNDIKLVDLKAILTFVYTGAVEIEGSQMESFISAAIKLKIHGLTNDAKTVAENLLVDDSITKSLMSTMNEFVEYDDPMLPLGPQPHAVQVLDNSSQLEVLQTNHLQDLSDFRPMSFSNCSNFQHNFESSLVKFCIEPLTDPDTSEPAKKKDQQLKPKNQPKQRIQQSKQKMNQQPTQEKNQQPKRKIQELKPKDQKLKQQNQQSEQIEEPKPKSQKMKENETRKKVQVLKENDPKPIENSLNQESKRQKKIPKYLSSFDAPTLTNKSFTCQFCGKDIACTNAARDKQAHESKCPENTHVVCPICSKFVLEMNISAHMERIHNQKIDY